MANKTLTTITEFNNTYSLQYDEDTRVYQVWGKSQNDERDIESSSSLLLMFVPSPTKNQSIAKYKQVILAKLLQNLCEENYPGNSFITCQIKQHNTTNERGYTIAHYAPYLDKGGNKKVYLLIDMVVNKRFDKYRDEKQTRQTQQRKKQSYKKK